MRVVITTSAFGSAKIAFSRSSTASTQRRLAKPTITRRRQRSGVVTAS